jgi:arylformamidase
VAQRTGVARGEQPASGDALINETIDAEYRVAPSQEAILASRRRAEALSSDARERLAGHLGVLYGQTPDEYVDIFPGRYEQSPVFVFFHGGFWRAMSARDYSYVALGPYSAGLMTISVNYALAPKATLDEIVQQARSAVGWVMRNAPRFGGDAGRIVLGGHSAGAQLAAMCLQTEWQEHGLDPSSIKGALLVSGLYDLTPLQHTFVQADLRFDESSIGRNSPLRAVQRLKAKVKLMVGDDESNSFKQQSLDFHTALSAKSTSSELEYVPGANHFGALEPLLYADSSMCRWLGRCVDVS